LRSGDSIFVSPSSLQIPVSGAVNSPGIYEALPDESLEDLISFAGGFSESFTGFNSVIVKRADLKSKELLEVSISNLKDFTVNARDAVMAPSFDSSLEQLMEVSISGMVNKPGKYYFLEGETLSDIIRRAGGYKDNAYVYGGALFRQAALEQEKLYAEINYSDTINFIVSNFGKPGASAINSEALTMLMEELKSKKYTGRVIANFDVEQLKQNKSSDHLLEHEDEIYIPAIQKVVYLFGEFNNPINLTYSSTYNVKDYLHLAGGLKDSANEELIVIDPDGRSHIYKSSKFFMAGSSIEIYPGSIIYAPRDVGKLSGLVYASTLSPILSSLAISIASLNSINN
jgi:protein involved in polysaccharide export with SLBB domain